MTALPVFIFGFGLTSKKIRTLHVSEEWYLQSFQKQKFMEKKVIYTSGAPSSPLYSQGIKAGDLIYLSGFTGLNPETKQLAGETIEEQTSQAIRNCESVLKSTGSCLSDVVQVIVLLSNPEDFDAMNKEYAKFFPTGPPTRMVTKLGVSLPKVKISIAMTAAV